MADRPLDLDFVRSFFPALNETWAFMENAGGSMVPYTVIDRVRDYMTECQVQPAFGYRASADGAERIAQGQKTVASMINADTDEVVIGPVDDAQRHHAGCRHSWLVQTGRRVDRYRPGPRGQQRPLAAA